MDGPVKVPGLSQWLPSEPPKPGEQFFGMDRSAEPIRLLPESNGGIRMPRRSWLMRKIGAIAATVAHWAGEEIE